MQPVDSRGLLGQHRGVLLRRQQRDCVEEDGGRPREASSTPSSHVAEYFRRQMQEDLAPRGFDLAYRLKRYSASVSCSGRYGLARNTPRAGMSLAGSFMNPEVRMSSIGGQRSRIARANFRPSIEPGMLMSLKTIRMSFRTSRM